MSYNNIAELKAAIQQLEDQKKSKQEELLRHFNSTKESLKPKNLIRSAIGSIDGAGVLSTAIKTAGAIGASLIAGKIAGGGAAVHGGKGLLRMFLKHTAGKSILNNRDKIKAYGTAILNNLFSKKNKPA
ncbi:MAG: hypothetical protein WD135_04460 [Ferruginibacter sp.]